MEPATSVEAPSFQRQDNTSTPAKDAYGGPIIWNYQDKDALPEVIRASKGIPPRQPAMPMSIDTPIMNTFNHRTGTAGIHTQEYSGSKPSARQPVPRSPSPLSDPMQLDIPEEDKNALARIQTLQPDPVWNQAVSGAGLQSSLTKRGGLSTSKWAR